MRRRIGLEIIALVCTVSVVLVSAIPLFTRQIDAKLIGLLFGAFGAGAMLANLIRDIKRGKNNKG
jgi:hypothetical protein